MAGLAGLADDPDNLQAMNLIELPLYCEADHWIVVFNRETKSRWGRLVRGRFKHVRAFAICPGIRVVLFYDMAVAGTTIGVCPLGPESARVIASWVGPPGASELVEIKRLPRREARWPLGLYCTSAIAHLLGLSLGALPPWPDRLFDACLKAGGRPIGRPAEVSPPAD